MLSEAPENKCRRVILGLGNLLFGDEGFGIHALEDLRNHLAAAEDVEWIEGGVMGLDLLPVIESCSHLLALDALDAGMPPGAVVQLERDQIPLFTGIRLSEHQMGFQEVLALAAFRGRLPQHLQLIGVQPLSLEVSTQLSPRALEALPKVRSLAQKVVTAWDN